MLNHCPTGGHCTEYHHEKPGYVWTFVTFNYGLARNDKGEEYRICINCHLPLKVETHVPIDDDFLKVLSEF